MSILTSIIDGLSLAAWMVWEAGWALVLGFTLTGIIDEFVSEERISQLLGDDGWQEIGLGAVFGAGSASSSYTAVATAKTLFKKGGSAAATLGAFQFAGTHLSLGLALISWILLGWQFVLAEIIGGLIAISILTVIYKYVIPDEWYAVAREHLAAFQEPVDPICGTTVDPDGEEVVTLDTDGETEYFCSVSCKEKYQNQQEEPESKSPWHSQLLSIDRWRSAAQTAIKQWGMMWEEIVLGFLIAGFVGALVPHAWWTALFSVGPDGTLIGIIAESIIGVLIAIALFLSSVSNVPFALVLWQNGVLFGGVMAFIFGDLLILPLINLYRRYYGQRMAAVMVGTMFIAAVVASVVLQYLFGGLGIIPPIGEGSGALPQEYTILLNLVFIPVFLAEMYIAVGPERIGEFVGSLPSKIRNALHQANNAYQNAMETLRTALRQSGEAIWLSGEAIWLLGKSVWLIGEAVRIIGATPFRMVAAAVQALVESRKQVRQKLAEARRLRDKARRKVREARRRIIKPLQKHRKR